MNRLLRMCTANECDKQSSGNCQRIHISLLGNGTVIARDGELINRIFGNRGTFQDLHIAGEFRVVRVAPSTCSFYAEGLYPKRSDLNTEAHPSARARSGSREAATICEALRDPAYTVTPSLTRALLHFAHSGIITLQAVQNFIYEVHPFT